MVRSRPHSPSSAQLRSGGTTSPPAPRLTRSTPAGAAIGAACLAAAALIALWLSGHFQAFNSDRGLLQFVVAIPLACLLCAMALAFTHALTGRQMLWAMLPVAGLILLGIGAFGAGAAAWLWAVAIGAVLFIPWMLGTAIGFAIRRPPESRGPPPT